MDTVYEGIVQARQHGEGAVLITVVEAEGSTPARLGAKLLVRANGARVGTVGGGALERAANAKAREILESHRAELVRYSLVEGDRALEGEPTGMVCGGRATLFFDYIGYSQHAFLFGGGHVGQALLRVLSTLPYYITVIDHRPEIRERLDGAARAIIADYATALQGEQVPPGSYFFIATASHEYDYEVLRLIMGSDWRPAYVGMIGSQRKVRANVDRLRQELGDAAPWEALYAPVGLDIGGPTPAEIAVAVAAEIQAVRYGKAGHRHLRLGHPQA
ncbi:MAG TPA: hypothetical protein GX714_02570 [Chloroflexi bacterium]|nr:hypothetical protein [Chloroflexota bacterium]